MAISIDASNAVIALLSGESGLALSLETLATDRTTTPVAACAIRNANLSVELAERAPTQYPCIHVYCERVTNNLKEKFAVLSGTAQVTVEVRVSANSIEDLTAQLCLYTEAVLDVLRTHRGELSAGLHYGGSYDVVYQPIRKGGDNLLQVAKISLPLFLHLA